MSDEEFKTHVEAGLAAAHVLDIDRAEAAYRAALTLRPKNSPVISALGLMLLARGRYAEGWPLYEHRRATDRTHVEGAGIPEWTGDPLDGRTLLVWPEQGLGDEIQLARYVPILARSGKVILVCSPPLERLFQQLGATVLPLTDGLNVPRPDVYTRNFSLPLKMGTTLETIPPAPYLKAPSAPKTGGVGFVWKGSPEHPNDRKRSLPSPAVLDPLRDVVELIDLQEPRGDFLDTAARIQALDRVISVDTSMVHLAGALGVPCWVMLACEGVDWRWMLGRTDSPWYPSLRLYRQTRSMDWTDVVMRMRDDLLKRV